MLIYSHNPNSKSARNLSHLTQSKRIKRNSKTFIGRGHKKVLNWGCSTLPPEVHKCQIINHPERVNLASDKLAFFEAVSVAGERDDLTVPYTTDPSLARQWTNEGLSVVCRTLTRASGGKGIVIADTPEEVVPAPLYTLYVKKIDEYRLHFRRVRDGSHECFLVQRKARKFEVENPDWRVRNHQNGFIFARTAFKVPDDCILRGYEVMKILDLDLGAVDIVWNSKQERGYVIEVNTAPGLEGSTVSNYTESLYKMGYLKV